MIKTIGRNISMKGSFGVIVNEALGVVMALGCICREHGIPDDDMIDAIIHAYSKHESIEELEKKKSAEEEILNEIYRLIKGSVF